MLYVQINILSQNVLHDISKEMFTPASLQNNLYFIEEIIIIKTSLYSTVLADFPINDQNKL